MQKRQINLFFREVCSKSLIRPSKQHKFLWNVVVASSEDKVTTYSSDKKYILSLTQRPEKKITLLINYGIF